MNDLISRKALIAEYDRVHIGPPGGARKLMEDAPAVNPPYPWLVRVHPVRLIFTRYYVECWRCHYCGKTKIGKKRAVRAWNKIWRG